MTKMTSTTATWIMNNCEQSNDLMATNSQVNDHLEHLHSSSLDELTCETTNDQVTCKDEESEKNDPLNGNLLAPIDYNMSPGKTVNGHLDDHGLLAIDSASGNECQIKDEDDLHGPVVRIASSTSDESHYGPYYRNSTGSLEDDDDDEYDDVLHDPVAVTSKLKEMEEEQEQLNNSLIALTSHFAQVQLRLKQIVGASSDEKERLLKELEEFAFTGIPDLNSVHQIVNQTQNQIGNQKESKCKLSETSNDSFDGKCDENISSLSKSSSSNQLNSKLKLNNESDLPSKLEMQREKQKELMNKLKEQLEELEKYAYETGDSKCIPSSMLIERQSVIIEQLKGTLALNLDQMDKLSPEELRQQVNQALKNLIDPVIMKEQLVEQLKTQVTDLERFIEYLQAGQVSMKCKNGSHFKLSTDGQCTCACPLHGNSVTSVQKYNPLVANERKKQLKKKLTSNGKGDCYNGDDEDDVDGGDESGSREAIKMIKRVMTLLQMVTVTQFGCNKTVKKYERNIFNKKSPNGANCFDKNDLWNDLKGKLDDAIDHLIEITQEKFANDSDYTSDSDDNVFTSNDDAVNDGDEDAHVKGHTNSTTKSELTSHEISSQGLRNQKLTHVVRKDLCNALADLLEHGLREDAEVSNTLIDLNGSGRSQSSAIVSSFLIWGCFSDQSSTIDGSRYSSSSSKDGKWSKPTCWDVFMKFYRLKDGTCYTSAPARRLSQSFNLPIIGGNIVTPKQSLLMAIFDICESHTPLKRSAESHFKALICRSLNEGKITSWLRLIVKSRSIIQSMYEPWSYVASTGFDEALESLEKLNSIRFNLPTDLAIRQLKSISDAF